MSKKSKLKKEVKALKQELADSKKIQAMMDTFKDVDTATLEQILPAGASSQFNNTVEGNIVPSVDVNGQRWDLFSRALSDRTLIVTGQVNDAMADIFIKAIMHLEGDKENLDKPIQVVINSPGGSVTAGLAMYDKMRESDCLIYTKVMGLAASMGSLLLCAGDHRIASRNSYTMIHQPMGGAQQGTQHTDMEITAGFMTNMRERLTQIYVDHTGLTHEEVDKRLQRDHWLSADEALGLGLVDEIREPSNKKLPKNYGAKRGAPVLNEYDKQRVEIQEVIKDRAKRLAKAEAANQNTLKKPAVKVAKNK